MTYLNKDTLIKKPLCNPTRVFYVEYIEPLKLTIMKRKLFYVVEKQLMDVGDTEEITGLKTVTVYEIVNNEPNVMFDIELSNSDNTEEEILGYLDDNGYEDETFELKQL